jgi:hypothetical protein
MSDPWLTAAQAARILGMTRRRIYQIACDPSRGDDPQEYDLAGVFEEVEGRHGSWKFRQSEVERLLALKPSWPGPGRPRGATSTAIHAGDSMTDAHRRSDRPLSTNDPEVTTW